MQEVVERNFIAQAFIDGGIPTMSAIAIVGVLTVLLILERFMTMSKIRGRQKKRNRRSV